jgi:hypothetical protein
LKPIRALAFALVAAALATPALAGPPGFAFLEVPAGARAAALGGAYASVARGAEAAFWNPAGLADFDGTQFTGTHTETYEHLRHDQVAVAGRLFGGGLAASMRAMYSEPIPERDDLGNLIGSFGSHDLEFLLGYGRKLTGGVSLGFTAQAVRERVADLAAGTWAVGAGAAWDLTRLPGVRASLGVHNVGPAGHYTLEGVQGDRVKLPAALHGGVSFSHAAFSNLNALLALDARATRGRNVVLAGGAELDAPVGAAVRFGVRAGDDIASWSAGMGWRTKALRIDYAFVPSKLELDDTHRFSLSASF